MVECLVIPSGKHITSTIAPTYPYEYNMHDDLSILCPTKWPGLRCNFRSGLRVKFLKFTENTGYVFQGYLDFADSLNPPLQCMQERVNRLLYQRL